MSKVTLPRPPHDVCHVSKLSDRVQGDATQIKRVFDQGAEDLRAYLNDDFAPAVEDAFEDLYGSGGGGGGGEDGATFTPSVSAEGLLSWANDKGLPNPNPVNIKGPQGPEGNGIKNIALVSGNHAPGTYDTYRITYTDGRTHDLTIYNGANGSGSGGSGGVDGATFTPSVSADGLLSWTNNKGLANPSSVNIKGPQGPAGPNEVSTATASSISGLLKGSGGKLAAAVAGTDYLSPGVKGAANGLASLDGSSKLSADQASARIVSVTASKTLALTDAGTLQKVDHTSDRTITIPTNSSVAFPEGTEIEILRYGSGAVTIVPSSGVTLRCAESVRTISKQYAGASLKKLGENEWLLMGSLG